MGRGKEKKKKKSTSLQLYTKTTSLAYLPFTVISIFQALFNILQNTNSHSKTTKIIKYQKEKAKELMLTLPVQNCSVGDHCKSSPHVRSNDLPGIRIYPGRQTYDTVVATGNLDIMLKRSSSSAYCSLSGGSHVSVRVRERKKQHTVLSPRRDTS